jgi:hypothetical protein
MYQNKLHQNSSAILAVLLTHAYTLMSTSQRKSSSAKSIHQWLSEPTAHSPIQQAHRLISLEKDWLRAVQLSLGSVAAAQAKVQAGRIARLEGGELLVLVSSSAARAKLKMLTPVLVSALRQQGWQVNAIRTQVQETDVVQVATSIPAPTRRVPQSAISTIEDVATAMAHSGIRQALKQLAKSSKPGSES